MLAETQCEKRKCKHFRGVINPEDPDAKVPVPEAAERPACAAFPDRIPSEIAWGEELHLTPYPGDGGITFERESSDGD